MIGLNSPLRDTYSYRHVLSVRVKLLMTVNACLSFFKIIVVGEVVLDKEGKNICPALQKFPF